MIISAENILLIGSILLFVSLLAGKAGSKSGIPVLLFFLIVGMLFGEDGLGVQFDDPRSAQFIGMLALSVILFSGGMDTNFKEVKPVFSEGVVMATLGVLVMTVVTGIFIYWISSLLGQVVQLTFPESLLLAAIMSSTDSASVFSILRSRGIRLKNNLRPTLELESGSNDPMAYMLTLLLVSVVQTQELSLWSSVGMIGLQLSVGFLSGFLLGKLSVLLINKINLDNASLYSVLLLAIVFFVFSITELLKGNGYLAVYIAGMVVGNNKVVHKKSTNTFLDGFAWLAQIVIFLTLGLLVNSSELITSSVASLGLTVGVFMILLGRPISVFLCLLPYKRISFKSKLYISWVGLRGAVPIIFATYPLIAGLEHAGLFFNVVFFITLLSLVIQGTTVASMARLLGVDMKAADKLEFMNDEVQEQIKSAMFEQTVTEEMLKEGNLLMNTKIPENTLVVMVKRKDVFFVPKGKSTLEPGDKLLLISDKKEL